MRNRIPIALQLYSVRDDCAGDLSLTLQAVAQMGYEGVEFAGYYDRTAEELRDMCDDLGLKVAGTHTGLNTLLGDELAKTVAFNQTLGNPYLIVPGLSEEYRNSQQAWLNTAKIFNDIAEKIADQGMFTGYHNHTVEFETLEGKIPWDTFGSNTREDVVMQIDIGHTLRASSDPVSFIQRYPGRSKLVHIKEYASTNGEALIGEGEIPW
ncbi:sugar phosphate isomerase/epimerase, partial [Candidatus Poribacteria bacterium]